MLSLKIFYSVMFLQKHFTNESSNFSKPSQLKSQKVASTATVTEGQLRCIFSHKKMFNGFEIAKSVHECFKRSKKVLTKL